MNEQRRDNHSQGEPRFLEPDEPPIELVESSGKSTDPLYPAANQRAAPDEKAEEADSRVSLNRLFSHLADGLILGFAWTSISFVSLSLFVFVLAPGALSASPDTTGFVFVLTYSFFAGIVYGLATIFPGVFPLLFASTLNSHVSDSIMPLFAVWYLTSAIGGDILYRAYMEASRCRGTAGKILLDLEVVDQDGEQVSIVRALTRNFLRYMSYSVLLGCFSFLLRSDRRMLHDSLSDTFVVQRRKDSRKSQKHATRASGSPLRRLVAPVVVALTLIPLCNVFLVPSINKLFSTSNQESVERSAETSHEAPPSWTQSIERASATNENVNSADYYLNLAERYNSICKACKDSRLPRKGLYTAQLLLKRIKPGKEDTPEITRSKGVAREIALKWIAEFSGKSRLNYR